MHIPHAVTLGDLPSVGSTQQLHGVDAAMQ
jgi:hypothetical protein